MKEKRVKRTGKLNNISDEKMQSCGSLKTSELKIMRVDLYATESHLLGIFSVFMGRNLSRKLHNDWTDVNGNVYSGYNDEILRLTQHTTLLLSLREESLSFCLKVSCRKVTFWHYLDRVLKKHIAKVVRLYIEIIVIRENSANGLHAHQWQMLHEHWA